MCCWRCVGGQTGNVSLFVLFAFSATLPSFLIRTTSKIEQILSHSHSLRCLIASVQCPRSLKCGHFRHILPNVVILVASVCVCVCVCLCMRNIVIQMQTVVNTNEITRPTWPRPILLFFSAVSLLTRIVPMTGPVGRVMVHSSISLFGFPLRRSLFRVLADTHKTHTHAQTL